MWNIIGWIIFALVVTYFIVEMFWVSMAMIVLLTWHYYPLYGGMMLAAIALYMLAKEFDWI